MQQARFVFLALAAPAVDDSGTVAETITWMLVSPNNRPLGRAGHVFDSYAACRDAVQYLRDGFASVRSTVSAVEATGQWVWRIDLAGAIVGISSRSYLRARECHYNLERFLEAVPAALVVAGTRSVRGGRPGSTNGAGDSAAPPARPTPRGARAQHQDVPAPGVRLTFPSAPPHFT